MHARPERFRAASPGSAPARLHPVTHDTEATVFSPLFPPQAPAARADTLPTRTQPPPTAMYAHMSPFRSANPRSAASAYAQIGLESGVQSADPHLLIGMLFDGALEAISLARKAIQERSYEAKSKAITRALRIVDQGLRSSLNMNSQPMADDLCALYSFVIEQLGHANLKNDDAALQNCSRVLKPLRDAWADIRGSVVTGPSA